MAAIHEGPEFGISDFVLLNTVDMESFMQNLKHRYVYISELSALCHPAKCLKFTWSCFRSLMGVYPCLCPDTLLMWTSIQYICLSAWLLWCMTMFCLINWIFETAIFLSIPLKSCPVTTVLFAFCFSHASWGFIRDRCIDQSNLVRQQRFFTKDDPTAHVAVFVSPGAMIFVFIDIPQFKIRVRFWYVPFSLYIGTEWFIQI